MDTAGEHSATSSLMDRRANAMATSRLFPEAALSHLIMVNPIPSPSSTPGAPACLSLTMVMHGARRYTVALGFMEVAGGSLRGSVVAGCKPRQQDAHSLFS